jgi:hypothetical protein
MPSRVRRSPRCVDSVSRPAPVVTGIQRRVAVRSLVRLPAARASGRGGHGTADSSEPRGRGASESTSPKVHGKMRDRRRPSAEPARHRRPARRRREARRCERAGASAKPRERASHPRTDRRTRSSAPRPRAPGPSGDRREWTSSRRAGPDTAMTTVPTGLVRSPSGPAMPVIATPMSAPTRRTRLSHRARDRLAHGAVRRKHRVRHAELAS